MTDDTATIERDLAAIEAALASGSATHEEPAARELQDLALALRAEAATPTPEFAEELGGRVRHGFPRGARGSRASQDAARERLAAKAARRPSVVGKLAHDFTPLAGVVATILLIVGLTVVLSGGSNEGALDDGGGGGGGAESAPADGGGAVEPLTAEDQPTQQGSGRAAGDTMDDALPISPGDPNFAPGQLNRRIERSYSLELEVARDQMNRVADDVTQVTSRHGGFVLNSSVSTGEDGGGGDFSLRIPSDRLRPALRDLAELAPVIRQSQQGRDVTRQHVTAKDRLQAARAERRSLLRRLEEAATDEEAEAIRRRLDLVSGQINGLRAQLRDLRLRTNYAVVNVTLSEAHEDSGELGSFGDSFDDAGNLLAGFAGIAIRVLALALPLGAIVLLGWMAGRVLRRWRRESALV
jgi:Domain of unknown function (DUF4349)